MTRSIQWLVAGSMLLTGALGLSAAAETPLIEAVKRGDTAAVKALLAKKADVNAAGVDTSTPLDWAVKSNNLEIVNLLIGAGVNVNAETRYKITPPALACTN